MKDLLHEALRKPDEERAAFLDAACAGDLVLRAELGALLQSTKDGRDFPEEMSYLNSSSSNDAATMEDSSAGLVGTDIGPYRVIGRLGRGGMGDVFLADDRRLGRQVAIKVLARRLENIDSHHLLVREARAIARLSHRNIASVYDVVEEGGRAHIIMECLRGETLAERLKSRPLSLGEVLDLARQMAAGLGHAHQLGIIHCDFKPANVFITTDGTLKVLDFGLARRLAAATDEPSEHLGAPPTLVRRRAGTPADMSPELLMGEPLDARSDVYSLGLVIHEMATGLRPARSPEVSPSANGRPSAELDPSLPTELRGIVEKALASNASDRFATAVDVEASLRAVSVAAPVWFHPTLDRRLVAAVVLVLSILGSVVALTIFRAGGDRAIAPATRAIVAVLPFDVTTNEPTAKYLAAGLAEIVTNDLSASRETVVVSSRSVRTAVGDKAAVADAARALGATHLVLGSLEPHGNRLHVALRVFDSASNILTTAETVDVTFAEIVGKQRRLTGAIRERLKDAGLPMDVATTGLTSAPADPQALEEYARGREYLDRGEGQNLDIALDLFETALARDPAFALAHAAVSEASWRKYRRTKDAAWATRAQTAALEALRLAPDEPRVRYATALALHGTGRTREAIDELTRVIAMQPTSDEAHRLLARIHAEASQMDKARPEFLAAIALRPGSWENYHALGVACFENGRYQEAIDAFERETQLRRDSASPFQALGTSYHAIGETDRAMENYRRAIAIAPSAFAYSNIGMIHYAKGRYGDAVAAYEQSAKIAPGEPVTYRNLADSLMKAGDTERAREGYRRAIQLAGEQLRINPKRARLLTLQAICDAKLGNRAAALRRAGSAVTMAPSDNEVLFQAAVVVALAEDADRAMRLLKQAVDHGYSSALIAGEEDLAALRDRADFKALLTPSSK